MKNLHLIILLIIACLFFAIGISIPGRDRPLHIIFVTAGVVIGFIFYLLVFKHILTSPSLSSGIRILWIILVVCVPMIGNLLYLIIQGTIMTKQVPKPPEVF